MNGKVFLDTNILVYAYDSHYPQKQAMAGSILKSGIEQDTAVLSVQVMGEFFVVVTGRIKSPLTPDQASEIIDILQTMMVVEIDMDIVKRAIDTHQRYRISYWDSLIVAAAETAGCETILSEDLNHGQTYNGVLVKDPFR